jgi:hypothetical protein
MDMTESNGQSGESPRQHAEVRGLPFEKVNGGRKPGSKNRTTLVAEALVKGEEAELMRTAIEMAKAGDRHMLTIFIKWILPKERTVCIDLPPMERADNAIDALAAILNAVCAGEITPNQGAALGSLVSDYARAINIHELESRLDKLESVLESIKGA